MAPFPPDTWLAEASELLAADAEVARLSQGVHLTVQQTVTSADGVAVWHLDVDDGRVTMHDGPAIEPTVTFTCDDPTANDIRLGTTSTQSVFMAGQLRVGGDVGALLRHHDLLASLSDALRPLRPRAG